MPWLLTVAVFTVVAHRTGARVLVVLANYSAHVLTTGCSLALPDVWRKKRGGEGGYKVAKAGK